MNIRRAHEKDIPRLIELLEQVLQIHADIRPDIFIPGTTKYTNEELAEMIKDDTKPIYVAADDDDICMGYAFCQIRQQPFSNNMVPFTVTGVWAVAVVVSFAAICWYTCATVRP